MRKLVPTLLSAFLMFAMASIVLARSAPQDRQASAVQSVLPDVITPVVMLQSVPPMTTGYDVICNLSTTQMGVVTTTRRGLRTTVDWRRANRATYSTTTRQTPNPVLLA